MHDKFFTGFVHLFSLLLVHNSKDQVSHKKKELFVNLAEIYCLIKSPKNEYILNMIECH